MFLFLKNFLKNRTIQVKAHNEISTPYTIENGIPQGSVISVTMFLIAINDIFCKIPNPTKHIIFADDCYIYCNGNNIATTLKILQSSLHILQNWSLETGFKFSATKCQYIAFNYKPEINQHLYLNNQPIAKYKNIKILGIIFNDNLKWTPHLRQLKSSCKNKMNVIKTLSHHTWGASQKPLLNIYKSLILSKIKYGSQIYNTAKPNILKILDPVHNEGIRLAIGAFRTSPIDSILNYAGELPLQFQRDQDTLTYIIKRKSTINHIGHKTIFNNHTTSPINMEHKRNPSVRDLFIKLQQSMDIHTSVANRITFQAFPPWKWELKLNTELLILNKNETNHDIIKSQFQNTIQHSFPNHTKIYTDASKSDHGVGLAVVKDDEIIQHKLPIITSIFSAENYAIFVGVQLANTLETNDILIISDSLSTLLALKNTSSKNEIISNIQACLIRSKKNIEFMWVPSHIGIIGNEKADKYADQATKTIPKPTINNISTIDIKNSIHQKILSSWQNHWNLIPLSNKLKNIKKTIKKWNTPTNFNRRHDIAITRTRIGHSFLTHSYLISKEPQPICESCHTALTIKHIMEECSQYSQFRTDLNMPPTIAESLGENQTHKILTFLSITNIIKKL